MKNNEVILHGECMVFPASLPPGAKKIAGIKNYHIVAKSEVVGNHHVVDVVDGVEFFEVDGRTFMQNSVPTTMRCVMPERHDTKILPPSTYEFGIQNEYDPFAARLVKSRD